MALRVEDVSLAERALVIEDGKGRKHHEVPMRPNWPVFWPCIQAAADPGEVVGAFAADLLAAPRRALT